MTYSALLALWAETTALFDVTEEWGKADQLQKQHESQHVKTPPATRLCLCLVWSCKRIWGPGRRCHSSAGSPGMSSRPESGGDWEHGGHFGDVPAHPAVTPSLTPHQPHPRQATPEKLQLSKWRSKRGTGHMKAAWSKPSSTLCLSWKSEPFWCCLQLNSVGKKILL